LVERSLTETLDEAAQAAAQASDWERDQEAWNLPRAPGGTIASGADKDDAAVGSAVRLVRGRFEAQFENADAAKAAARDARAVGFVVDVQQDTAGWFTVGRRQLPFPSDERDRYASRIHAIATRHHGAFSRFVEEPPETLPTQVPRDN
jgi:hypothetical protein